MNMLNAIKLLVAITALAEVWLFGSSTDFPSHPIGWLAILAGIAWVLSPLVALFLPALENQLGFSKKVTLLITSFLSSVIAAWFLGPWVGPSSGLEVFAVPALQWVVVIAGLITLGVLNRRHHAGSMHT